MDILGHNFSQATVIVGPLLILSGFAQFIFYRFFLSYSGRTVEELNEKSFLGLAGTMRTKEGGKITMSFGVVVFVIMLASELL